jgi:hypothetical protein
VFAKLRQRRNDRHVLLRFRQRPTTRTARTPQGVAEATDRRGRTGLEVNDHIAEAGDVVFRHACQLGFEGIVAKRLGSRYVSGRYEEPERSSGETGSGGRLGQRAVAMTEITLAASF